MLNLAYDVEGVAEVGTYEAGVMTDVAEWEAGCGALICPLSNSVPTPMPGVSGGTSPGPDIGTTLGVLLSTELDPGSLAV